MLKEIEELPTEDACEAVSLSARNSRSRIVDCSVARCFMLYCGVGVGLPADSGKSFRFSLVR